MYRVRTKRFDCKIFEVIEPCLISFKRLGSISFNISLYQITQTNGCSNSSGHHLCQKAEATLRRRAGSNLCSRYVADPKTNRTKACGCKQNMLVPSLNLNFSKLQALANGLLYTALRHIGMVPLWDVNCGCGDEILILIFF